MKRVASLAPAVLCLVLSVGCEKKDIPASAPRTEFPLFLETPNLGGFDAEQEYDVKLTFHLPSDAPIITDCGTSCGCIEVASLTYPPRDGGDNSGQQHLELIAHFTPHGKRPGAESQLLTFYDKNGLVIAQSTLRYCIAGFNVSPRAIGWNGADPTTVEQGKIRVTVYGDADIAPCIPVSPDPGLVIRPMNEWQTETFGTVDGEFSVHLRDFVIETPGLQFGGQVVGKLLIPCGDDVVDVPVDVRATMAVSARPKVMIVKAEEMRKNGAVVEFVAADVVSPKTFAESGISLSPSVGFLTEEIRGEKSRSRRFHIRPIESDEWLGDRMELHVHLDTEGYDRSSARIVITP